MVLCRNFLTLGRVEILEIFLGHCAGAFLVDDFIDDGHRRFRESEVRALLEGDGVVEEMREDDAANRPRNTGPTNPGMGYGPPNGLR